MSNLALIAISIGNSQTHIGFFKGTDLEELTHVPNDDRARAMETITSHWKACSEAERRAIASASVNETVSNGLVSVIEDQLSEEVYRVGEDMPIPIGLALDPEATPGVDRLLGAAAAWDTLKQACVIINAGTAVTIDFVDGEGVFHGGVIAPGAQMQMDAMHTGTDALPELEFAVPSGEPFGRNTAAAMQRGVFNGIRGLAWKVVEEFASAYEAFPMVVATGGDAIQIFEGDELINRLVPDLEIRGIAIAVRHALAESVDAEE